LKKDFFKNFLSVFSGLTKKKGLTRKLGLLILSVIIIPILIIDIISITSSVNLVIGKSKESYLSATVSAGEFFNLLFKNVEDISLQLMSNDVIQKIYSESKSVTVEEYEKYTLKSNAQNMLMNVLNTNNIISAIYIVTNKDTSLFYPTSGADYIDFKKLPSARWYKNIMSKNGQAVWINDHKELFDDVLTKNNFQVTSYIISLGRPFRDVATANDIGVMLMDINDSRFKEHLANMAPSEHGYLIAISPEGKVIIPDEAQGKFNQNSKFINKVINNIKKGNLTGAFQTVENRKGYLVTFSNLEDTQWTFVGVIELADVVKAASKLRLLVILITVIFTLVAVMLGLYFAIKIVNDLEVVTNTMAVASKGDLRVQSNIKRDDEIGILSDSFNQMANNIKDLISKGVNLSEQVTTAISNVAAIATQTSTASNEVAKAIQEIAEGAGNQAKEASAVVESVAKFGEKIDMVVGASDVMDKLSDQVSEITQDGIKSVETLDRATQETVQIIDNMVKSIKQLGEYSRSINKIIQLLSNISEQTKLLALNASIEAAKAGDAGRGFAVVASEIRKLADQSKTSTRDVEEIIKQIIAQTKNAENVANAVEKIVGNQSKAVENVTDSFNNITSAMEELSEKIEAINQSINVLDKEKDEIIRKIENISAISQETAASSEEVSAATEEQLAAIEELSSMTERLSGLAQELAKAMELFKV